MVQIAAISTSDLVVFGRARVIQTLEAQPPFFKAKGFVIIQGTTIFTLPDNSALAQVHLKPMDEWRQEVRAALQDW